jgi:hypothetical protein
MQRSIGRSCWLVVAAGGLAHGQTSELAKLLASNGSGADSFGFDVSICGERVLVGAPMCAGNGVGAAYLFERDASGAWPEVARLEPSDGQPCDAFGWSVSIEGDRALIGAPGDDDRGNVAGAVYVFERDAGGAWMELAKLHPSDAAANDQFGYALQLSGDRALVGAPFDGDLGAAAGAAYVFERDAGGAWTEVAKLHASDGAPTNQFGQELSLDGDVAVVGAWQHDHGAMNTGGAYVYERDAGGAWLETAELVASDAAANDNFGIGLSVSGEGILVGAYGDDVRAGAAYAFVRSGGAWVEEAKLVASDRTSNEYFGISVALDGSRAVVGSTENSFVSQDPDHAYVFERSGSGTWTEVAMLIGADTALADFFGTPVALSGDRTVVGAGFDDDLGFFSGSAYLFDVEPLSSSVTQISLASGGSQPLSLDAGHLHAGENYWLLGSMSGTSPGIPLPGGLLLPLNPDRYFTRTLERPNLPPLANSKGTLNASGHADAAFTTVPLDVNLAGLTVHHAFVTLGAVAAASTGSSSTPAPAPALATFASNAFALTFVP